MADDSVLVDGGSYELSGWNGRCSIHGQGKCGPVLLVVKVSWGNVLTGVDPLPKAAAGLKIPEGWRMRIVRILEAPDDHFREGPFYGLDPSMWESVRRLSDEEMIGHVL